MKAKQPDAPPQGPERGNAEKPSSADRRKWLKAGLSTPPVLMTVASRPVLANACVPPSAYVSLGASAPGMYGECAGFGPETWLQDNTWPSPYSPDARFNTYFEPNLNGNPRFSDVLGDGNIANVSDTVHTVARYVTAALLNNASGKVPETVLRAMTIQHIWTEYAQTGAFAPTSGASWSAAEIVDYLRSTMTSV